MTSNSSQPTSLFTGSECPAPSRFWKVAMGLECWTTDEQQHVANCVTCNSHAVRIVETVAQTAPPVAPGLATWLQRGLGLLGSVLDRVSGPRLAGRSEPVGRLGLEMLEDRDTPTVVGSAVVSAMSLPFVPALVAACSAPRPCIQLVGLRRSNLECAVAVA